MQEADDSNRPFDIWIGVQQPNDGTHERLVAAGVTMVNGTNFLNPDGRTALSSIDDKKRRVEGFTERFIKTQVLTLRGQRHRLSLCKYRWYS